MLVSLHRGYGLGDAVQMSSVLRHIKKHRPQWRTDLQAEAGRHCIGRGLVDRHFEFGDNPGDRQYIGGVEILLYDTWANWQDRPNTRVSSCLHERFGLPWDEECARYQINVREECAEQARAIVHTHRSGQYHKNRKADKRNVAVHYEGDSSGPRKNLTHQQADRICAAIEALDYVPLILDWRERCPLDYRKLRSPNDWGRDAEMVCAVIAECAAFIGIDSGPSKCASATDTPALVIWTGHHPAPFHDPAPNTTHLVPRGYHGLHPVCNNPGVIKWFEACHVVHEYDHDLVGNVAMWLRRILK